MARLPGVGALFVAAEHELGGDEQTVLQAGVDAQLGFDAVVVPSWRFVTDLGDPDASVAVLTTGQSGNPASPHWNDQAGLWASGGGRPVHPAAVEAVADRSLRLSPGGIGGHAEVPTAPAPRHASVRCPAAEEEAKASPAWYGYLVLGLILLGVLIIVFNYADFLLPGGTQQHWLWIGLGVIAAGFIAATRWR